MDQNIKIDWEKRGGLIPTILQDYKTLEVLTLAYSNKESFEKLLETKQTYLFSTSRSEIWRKGGTSGNTQEVIDIFVDCDNDALVIKVKKKGPACHQGTESCFRKKYNGTSRVSQEDKEGNDILKKLEGIILGRLLENSKNSYVTSLKGKNGNKVLEKIIEEAGEFILALKDNNSKEIIGEFSDLLFHSLVALNMKGIFLKDIKQELKKRFAKSGVLEKKTRGKSIVLIDYGSGNIKSVENCLMRLGVEFRTSSNKTEIRDSDLIIFPGVGNAEYAMKRLEKLNLLEVIKNYKKPFLGICLGMQLLFEQSEEGNVKTLGLVPGIVKKFESSDEVVPHMGWNNVWHGKEGEKTKKEEKYFYFVHSYFCPVGDYTLGVTHYIEDFSSLVRNKNFFGCQFHPEKSGEQGRKFMEEFLIDNL